MPSNSVTAMSCLCAGDIQYGFEKCYTGFFFFKCSVNSGLFNVFQIVFGRRVHSKCWINKVVIFLLCTSWKIFFMHATCCYFSDSQQGWTEGVLLPPAASVSLYWLVFSTMLKKGDSFMTFCFSAVRYNIINAELARVHRKPDTPKHLVPVESSLPPGRYSLLLSAPSGPSEQRPFLL